jgi:hypothetical protein
MGTTRISAEGSVGRGLSPAIWQAYGFIGGNLYDPSLKPFFFDDFMNLGLYADSTCQGGMVTHQDTGVTIQQCASLDNSEGECGVLEVAGNDAEDDEGYIELGGATGGIVRIDPTAGERAVVAFEARIKRTTVTDDHTAFAFGIGEPGFAAQDAITADTGVLAAKDFVGFQTLMESNEEIDAIYSIGSGSVVQITDNCATSVADTWMKFGGIYDPLEASGKKLRMFIDGTEISYDTPVTDAIISAGTAFPTDEELTLVFLTRNNTQDTTAHAAFMDWWAVGTFPVDV